MSTSIVKDLKSRVDDLITRMRDEYDDTSGNNPYL